MAGFRESKDVGTLHQFNHRILGVPVEQVAFWGKWVVGATGESTKAYKVPELFVHTTLEFLRCIFACKYAVVVSPLYNYRVRCDRRPRLRFIAPPLTIAKRFSLWSQPQFIYRLTINKTIHYVYGYTVVTSHFLGFKRCGDKI